MSGYYVLVGGNNICNQRISEFISQLSEMSE